MQNRRKYFKKYIYVDMIIIINVISFYQNYELDSLEESNKSKCSVSSLTTSAKDDMQELSRSINNQYDFSESREDDKNYIDVTGLSSNYSSVQKLYGGQ